MPEHEQRSDGWHAERLGMLTASRFADAIALTQKGAPTQARTTYLTEVVVERLTGRHVEHFESIAMRWGTEHEDAAVAAYEAYTGRSVARCGFRVHPAASYAGASPDGLTEQGTIEVKCPFNSANHLAAWLGGMSKDHMAQVQGQLWVTGRAYCDFVSYDPRMPEGLDIYIERVARDDTYIAQLAMMLADAWRDITNMEAQIVEAALRQSEGRQP